MKLYADRLVELLAEENARGVSERQVALEAGMHPRLLNAWKNRGSMGKDPRQFMLLCRRLRTHPNYLMGWSNQRYPHEESPLAAALDSELAARRKEYRGPQNRKG